MLNKYGGMMLFLLVLISCKTNEKEALLDEVKSFEEKRIEKLVTEYMGLPALTVTDTICVRSAGSRHDFYSEGDYWWPDPENPDGPYIRRDGMSNPGNFKAHRHAMVRMSRIVGAMTSAWLLSNDEKFAHEAMQHLNAWFVDEETKMNPHLLYSQAIQGRYTGRGIGIIDGLHLVEVARSAQLLSTASEIDQNKLAAISTWFSDFLTWMSTHEYGKAEMVHPNNHGTVWAVQAAAYASLSGNNEMLAFCKNRLKEQLLPSQMADDGSFPLELERTKPYGYSLFNLDAMSLLAQILTLSGDENLWKYTTEDGRGLKRGLDFIYPYIEDKTTWPYQPDVLYWDNWPVAQASLVLGGIAYASENYIDLWKQLEHDPETTEVQRNLVLRYPLLWLKN
ncbi:alginate lyase family protein [Roseimarinus sediminis]|uniref:alginate lyase family protein n=1 Tax=Roseimarinus sediminis TaxID=1610899 RepID=UPI003D1D1033